MKKVLILGLAMVLALSLFTACGGNSDGGSNSNSNNSAKQDEKIVKSSELITLEDAERILGMDLQVNVDSEAGEEFDKAEQYGGLRTVYVFDGASIAFTPYMLQITVRQNSLLDKNNSLDKTMIENGGISYYAGNFKKSYENDNDDMYKVVWVDGMGDWACITKSPIHSIQIYYNEYLLDVTITGREKTATRSDEEESAWKQEKLKDAGNLALENLKAILG